MSEFTVWAITAPLNAFICCAFITFFMKRMKISTALRMTITFIAYVLLSFIFCSGGNGLFEIDMTTFQLPRFLLYVASGFCVCLGIYFFFERGTISKKLAEKRDAKKQGKK